MLVGTQKWDLESILKTGLQIKNKMPVGIEPKPITQGFKLDRAEGPCLGKVLQCFKSVYHNKANLPPNTLDKRDAQYPGISLGQDHYPVTPAG